MSPTTSSSAAGSSSWDLMPSSWSNPSRACPLRAQRLLKIVASVVSTRTWPEDSGEDNLQPGRQTTSPSTSCRWATPGARPRDAGQHGGRTVPRTSTRDPSPLRTRHPRASTRPSSTLCTGSGPSPRPRTAGNGAAGGRGGKGVTGANGPVLGIRTTEIDGILNLDLRGQQGGLGGKGGNGQFGGNAHTGSTAVPGTDTTWLGCPEPDLQAGPSAGRRRGDGGNAGCGGDGGDGGNGGTVKVFYTSGVNLTNIHPLPHKGERRAARRPGKAGNGRKVGARWCQPPSVPPRARLPGWAAQATHVVRPTGDNKQGGRRLAGRSRRTGRAVLYFR